MQAAHVEYVGFTATVAAREYKLTVRNNSQSQDVTVAIPNTAFLTQRARFQDAPDICFLIIQRELAAGGGVLGTQRFDVTDADLEEYRTAHAPRPARRRPRPVERPSDPGHRDTF